MKKVGLMVVPLVAAVLQVGANGVNVAVSDTIQSDSVKITERYLSMLDSLSVQYADELGIQIEEISDNPLYFRLFMPLALYNSALDEAIYPTSQRDSMQSRPLLPIENLDSTDADIISSINATLVKIYLDHPELVKMTESELMSVKGPITITEEATVGIKREVNSEIQVENSTEAPDLVTSKPNYWKLFGNFQGKYTQSYFSENWYKGGQNSHSVLAQVVLEANYAKRQTTLDNKLEMKLGYYTTEVNGEKTLKTNQDLLRATSKYGLRAIESWYYSAQLQGYTQFMPVFDNKNNLKSKFLAPVYGSLSIGMDYKPKFKNKNLTLSAMLSPLSYDCRYVSVDSIVTRYGIDQGKNFKYSIGSRVDANLSWKFLTNFKLTTKANYFTDYKRAEANIENTIDYQFSKYFSIQFFMHWRFDDNVKKPHEELKYHQLKEFLTLNFNYSW